MDTQSCLACFEEETQLDRLSEWLGRWEPCLSISRPQRDALLYEPEGTLYAIAVETTMTVNLFHRQRTIRKGDAIVVPPGLAMELNPEVDLLAIRSSGTPPAHFRERFIQVWGYEHFRTDTTATQTAATEFREVIPESDPRFAVSYAIWQLQDLSARGSVRNCIDDVVVLLNLDRDVRQVVLDDSVDAVEIPPRHVLGLCPGVNHRLCTPGELGCLRLVSEAIFVARAFLRQSSRGGSFVP